MLLLGRRHLKQPMDYSSKITALLSTKQTGLYAGYPPIVDALNRSARLGRQSRIMTRIYTWPVFAFIMVANCSSAAAETCCNVAAFIVSTQADKAADPAYSVQTEWSISNISGSALTPWVALSAQKVPGGIYGNCIPQVGGKEVKKFWDHMLTAGYPRLDVPQRCWCSPEINVLPSIHIKVSKCGQRKRSRKLLSITSTKQGDPGDPDPFNPMYSGLINITSTNTVMDGWFLAGHDAEVHCSGKNRAGTEIAFVMWPQDSCWDPGW